MSLDHQTAALSNLRQTHAKKERAAEELTQTVVDARAVKATWDRIATELGILQPNATRKYKPAVETLKARQLWQDRDDQVTLALLAVGHALRELKDLEAAELQAVADARTVAVRWDDIAEVFGMLQPNVIAKYKPLLVEERRVYVRPDLVAGEHAEEPAASS